MHIVNSILQDLIYEEDSRKNNNSFSLSFVTEKVHRKYMIQVHTVLLYSYFIHIYNKTILTIPYPEAINSRLR